MSQTRPRKITVVAREVRSDGGMERAMMEMIVGLLELGWRVTLIASVCELDAHQRLRWVRVPAPRRPFIAAFPLFALLAGARLRTIRRRGGLVVALGAIIPNRVDVIVVQFCHAAFARQGIIQTARDSFMHRWHSRVAQKIALGLERWCYRPGRVRQMIAVSDLVKEEVESFYQIASASIDVIPNGVDLDRFRPSANDRVRERERLGLLTDDLVAVFVGGDWPRKGLDIAIDAATRAGWKLIVVGRGDIPKWEAKAKARGAEIIFCGHLSSPERLYCAADAFLLPSRDEGFALVVIEAAAAGLPLLVTEATGAAALAEKAGSRALPRGVDAFAAELQRLGGSPELRAELGRRSRAAAEELAWPRIVSAYATVYALAEGTPLA